MGGDRAYITTLLIAVAVLCLVVVGARWVVLAHRVPLRPLPASAAASAGRAADTAAAHAGGDGTNTAADAPSATSATAAGEPASVDEAAAAGGAEQPAASSASAASHGAVASSKSPQAPTAQHKLELNGATAAQLDLLPGIGPTLAQRIVDYRKQHGPFKRAEELLNVSGIGEHKLADIKELVYVKPAQ